MKTITFNNKQYNIPQEWSEVTIAMLIQSSLLADILDEAPIIAIVSAFTNIPVQQLKSNKAIEVQDILTIMTFVDNEYKPEPSTSFEFNGETYYCNEDLTQQNFEDWVSIQTALFNYKDNLVKALPRMIAILCKKKGETLDDFDLTERSKMFEALPMTKAKDIEAFFLSSINAYKSLTLLSSIVDINQNIALAKIQELQNTAKAYKERTGTSFFTKLQIGALQSYLKLVKEVLVRYSSSEPTKPLKKTWKQTCKSWLSKTQNVRNNGRI